MSEKSFEHFVATELHGCFLNRVGDALSIYDAAKMAWDAAMATKQKDAQLPDDYKTLQRLFRERIKSHYDENCGNIGATIDDDDSDSLARACVSVLQEYSPKQEST